MKFLYNIILQKFKIAEKPKPLLGRWNIDYCIHKINKKIDFSNEDHCGPCGQYTNKINSTKSDTFKNIKDIQTFSHLKRPN